MVGARKNSQVFRVERRAGQGRRDGLSGRMSRCSWVRGSEPDPKVVAGTTLARTPIEGSSCAVLLVCGRFGMSCAEFSGVSSGFGRGAVERGVCRGTGLQVRWCRRCTGRSPTASRRTDKRSSRRPCPAGRPPARRPAQPDRPNDIGQFDTKQSVEDPFH